MAFFVTGVFVLFIVFVFCGGIQKQHVLKQNSKYSPVKRHNSYHEHLAGCATVQPNIQTKHYTVIVVLSAKVMLGNRTHEPNGNPIRCLCIRRQRQRIIKYLKPDKKT